MGLKNSENKGELRDEGLKWEIDVANQSFPDVGEMCLCRLHPDCRGKAGWCKLIMNHTGGIGSLRGMGAKGVKGEK